MPLSEFIDLLRCPETQQTLTVASLELLGHLRTEQVAGRLIARSGKPVTAPVEAGLLRLDGNVLYLVCNGIPVLVVEEGIVLTRI
ncbi:MAG: hypothetical protein WCD79_10315 [Chthoniobacteraceae bacterium]